MSRNTATYFKFEGPYGRYYRAVFDIEHPDEEPSSDPWVRKLVCILKLEDKYAKLKGDGRSKMMNDWPLFYNLLEVFRSNSTGSDKELIEACLLASDNFEEIESCINIPRFNRLFIALYHELFFNIRDTRSNDQLFARYVLLPMLSANTEKLAIGNVWKLLAVGGGLPLLKSKGFGIEPLRPEDIGYLLQLCTIRNCTSLFKYASIGDSMFIDNPGALTLIDRLADFDSIRPTERRKDGFLRISSVSTNMFNDMLTNNIKLISLPKDLDEDVFKADGSFHPELVEAIEKPEHNNI